MGERIGRSQVYVDMVGDLFHAGVIEDAPFELTDAFLKEYDIKMVVHGDDLTAQGANAVYGAAAAAGKFTLVPRTADVSSTEVIQRVLRAAR